MKFFPKILFFCLTIALECTFPCPYVFAYRPFVSTDAAVADNNAWEIELGLFNMANEENENDITVPSVRVNYGILKNWEVVAELDIQVYKAGGERNGEIRDPGLFLKGILHEGILQDQKGLSVALEGGLLLPSTLKGERKLGLESTGIVSYKIDDFLLHANLGIALDRSDFDLNLLWGIIVEYPYKGRVRIVSEINGTAKPDGFPENSGLLGLILGFEKFDLDVGGRKGFSEAATDWEFTTGITLFF